MSVLHEMLETGRRRARHRNGRRRGPVTDGGTVSINAAAREVGVSPSLLRYRMKKCGMTLEDAVFFYKLKKEEKARMTRAVDEIVGIIMEE